MESAFNEIKNVYIYLYQKMDCTTDFYRSFGELLTKYAALSKVTYKEVSAELGHSPTELVSSIIHHPSSLFHLPSFREFWAFRVTFLI